VGIGWPRGWSCETPQKPIRLKIIKGLHLCEVGTPGDESDILVLYFDQPAKGPIRKADGIKRWTIRIPWIHTWFSREERGAG
jgi:hypothetical protein